MTAPRKRPLAASTGTPSKAHKQHAGLAVASRDPRFDTADFSDEEDPEHDGRSPCSGDGSGTSDDDGGASEDEDLLAALEEPSSDDEDAAEQHGRQPAAGAADGSAAADPAEPSGAEPGGVPVKRQRSDKKVLAVEKVARMTAVAEKRGIVYISRIPPHMKPHKLRQLLAEHGEIGRVYCAPEDPALRRLRKQHHGNTGKNFTEGWVEFDDKRRAKRAALLLNGQPMGGRHRSAYRYDLWNIKYLPRFKWDHLTEEVAYQRAVREQKLAAEIRAAKRERDFYLSRVDRAKGIAAQEERRTAKAAAATATAVAASPANDGPASGGMPDTKKVAATRAPQQTDASGAAAAVAATSGGDGGAVGKGKERHYGQRRLKPDPTHSSAPEMSGEVLAMLGGKTRR